MRKSMFHLIALSLLLPLLFFGCGSLEGDDGAAAPTTGTISGTITDGVAGDPLAGVTVTAKDSGGTTLATATTDASGGYSLSVPIGSVEVYCSKDFYTSPNYMTVGVLGGRAVTMNATMSQAASGKPSVSVAAAANDVGYGNTVALTATATDPNGDTLTYSWSNTTAPALGSVSGSGASGSITMPTMAEAMEYRPDPSNPGLFISGYRMEDRFGILPIIPDTRAQISAAVTVSDGRGGSTAASITVDAASVLTGVKNVPLDVRVYLNRGNDNNAQTWTLVAPSGSAAALDNDAVRNPYFVPDVAGKYTVSAGGNSMDLYAARWVGAIDGGTDTSSTADNCMQCHNGAIAPDMFTPWLATGHASILRLGINGGSGTRSASCLVCHTVGYDAGADNGGFDDAATAAGWTFPSVRQAGNWAGMLTNAPTVAKLGNIQCESCHGPNGASSGHMKAWEAAGNTEGNPFTSTRISFNAEVCGTCHGRTSHHLYSEWATPNAQGIGHSNRALAVSRGTSTHCGRCHAAQGFTKYVEKLEAGTFTLTSADLDGVTSANAEPVTCTACHDPHDATNPNQLRIVNEIAALPAGFGVSGAGKGALCMACHNTRNGAHDDSNAPTSFSAPHTASQADVFMGRNAYFMGGSLPMTSRHAAIEDTCVGCHMVLQPQTHVAHGADTPSSHLFRITGATDVAKVCANCHGSLVNGEGTKAAIEAGLHDLKHAIEVAFLATIQAMTDDVAVSGAIDPTTDTTIGTGIAQFPGSSVTSVELIEGHGQIAFVFNTSSPVDFGGVTSTHFDVQLRNVKNAATTAAVYAANSNLVKAGWNFFLIEGDDSFGIHNPGFAQQVINATLAQTL